MHWESSSGRCTAERSHEFITTLKLTLNTVTGSNIFKEWVSSDILETQCINKQLSVTDSLYMLYIYIFIYYVNNHFMKLFTNNNSALLINFIVALREYWSFPC